MIELRRELEGWLRRALLGGEDVEALWSYMTTPFGADDLQVWRRFLANSPHGDGRRGLAAPRLERLRATYAYYRRSSVEPAVDHRSVTNAGA